MFCGIYRIHMTIVLLHVPQSEKDDREMLELVYAFFTISGNLKKLSKKFLY